MASSRSTNTPSSARSGDRHPSSVCRAPPRVSSAPPPLLANTQRRFSPPSDSTRSSSRASGPPASPTKRGLYFEQAVEEFPVPLQRDAKILCRNVVATPPLLFEVRARLGELAGQRLQQL